MKGLLVKVAEFLTNLPKSFLLISGFLFAIFLGVIRYLTEPEFAFSIFYLLPICLITWFVGKWAGILIAILSAVTWFLADLMLVHSYSYPFTPYLNEILMLSVFLIIIYILSSLKGALEREKALAMTDFLTKIANRRAFFEFAHNEISRARRYKHPFTVVLTDLDKFKNINDHFGHQTGDTLLCLVADTLKKNLRTTDIVARVGGDEFIMLLPETGVDSAWVLVHRLHSELLDIMQKNGWPVLFSFGKVTFHKAPGTVDEMMRRADTLMYSAKQDSVNKIHQEVVD